MNIWRCGLLLEELMTDCWHKILGKQNLFDKFVRVFFDDVFQSFLRSFLNFITNLFKFNLTVKLEI
jgi:hypothetical protein